MNRFILVVVMLFLFSQACLAAGEGTLKGKLTSVDNKPLSEGVVYFFSVTSPLERPITGKFWRVPDFVHKIDAEGRFEARLPVGNYYIAAIKRAAEGRFGPPQEGDFFLPVHDDKGIYRTVVVKDGVVSDIGTLTKIGRYSASNYVYKGEQSAIEGKILTSEGTPVSGLSILGYLNPEMTGPPQFVSAPSQADGGYRLPVDKGRTLYLKVRSGYAGGMPQAGALVGVYGDFSAPEPVEIITGKVTKGIDIIVVPFAGSGKPM